MTKKRILIDFDGQPTDWLLDNDRAFVGLPELPATVFKSRSVGMTVPFLLQHYVFVLRELTKLAVEARKLHYCMAQEVDRVSCRYPDCRC